MLGMVFGEEEVMGKRLGDCVCVVGGGIGG